MVDDACNSLLQAEALIVQYPDTAGQLRFSYDSVKRHWEKSTTTKENATPIAAELWTNEARKFWKDWGNYEIGYLVYCKKGHPYSKRSLAGCPECGRMKIKGSEIQAEYERKLNRDEFLRSLNQMVGFRLEITTKA